MIEWFIYTLSTSAVAQGVLAGAVAAAPITMFFWLVRDLPKSIWNFFKKQVSRNVVVLSDLSEYDKIVSFADDHIIWTRNHTIRRIDSEFTKKLGYGTHWGKYKGVFFMYRRILEEGDPTYNFKEKSTFTFFTRKDIETSFFKEATKSLQIDFITYSRNDQGYWEGSQKLAPRKWDSVFSEEKEPVLDFIKTFETSEDSYLEKGIPYHAGILLHGVPGTGKTSLVHALCHKTGRSPQLLDLHDLKKGQLISLLEQDWSDKFLVIEDIDASGVPKDRDGEGKLTMAALLNALDGLATPHGMITIATTNHIDKLDPALVRPGRFDLVTEVGKLSLRQATRMAKAYGQQLDNYTPMTGAELVNKLLKNNS